MSGNGRPVMLERDGRKNGMRRILMPPTQNGGEKSIEYDQLKAAALAGERQ